MIQIDWLQVWWTISLVISVFLVVWIVAYRAILGHTDQKEVRPNVRKQW